MDLQMTQVLDDEKPAGDDDDSSQVGILRVGTTEHSIVKGFTKIGRSPALCRIVINDVTVSKVHAEIQAGCETVFISDVRSANGTKIKDVSLKPFFYYTINDGDTIYIGAVKAIFTTGKSKSHNAAVVPETPLASRWPSETNTPGGGNTSDCLFNNSSVYQSDDSVVPGTQRKEKSRIFQQPPVPVGRRNAGIKGSPLRFRNARAISPSVSENSGQSERSDKATKLQDETDRHDLEPQLFETRSRTPKKSNSPDNKRDLADENVYDKETQIMSRPTENEGAANEPKSNRSRMTDTAASSSCGYNSSSNFSRELQMSTSPSPPDSPNPVDHSADMNQSQDLLELCETRLFAKKMKSPDNSKASKGSPIAMESTINRRGPVASSHVIAESDDESATDDDMDIDIVKAEGVKAIPASNASDTIDDDSATDDEGKFESLASLTSPKETSKTSSKSRGAAATDRDAQADIFEAATQRMDQEPPDVSSKTKTRQMAIGSDAKTNIFMAGKQRLDQTHKPTAQDRNSAVPNIFDAETQEMDYNEKSVVTAGTTIGGEKTVDPDTDVNIYDAATQRVDDELPSAKKRRIPDLDADANIFEAATQQMDHSPSASAKKRRNPPKDREYDADIDLLPTQVLEEPTSSPTTRSRKSNTRNFEKSPRLDVDDGIHLAPTQIRNDADDVADQDNPERSTDASPSLGEKNTAKNKKRAAKLQLATSTPVSYSVKSKKQNAKKSPPSGAEDSADSAGTVISSDRNVVTERYTKKRSVGDDKNLKGENAGEERDNRPVNLDETLMRNLGRILDEEANDGALEEEPTQLMTQNLVDILKPTQSFDSETKSRDSSDEIVGDVCEPPTPKRRKLSSPGTLGFVDGKAVGSSRWSNASPAASSTMREHENEDGDKTKDASEERQLPEWLDPDSIFYGLPEVKISGTLSNPGSPCPSTSSTHSDFVVPTSRGKAKTGKSKENVSPGSTEALNSSETSEVTKSLALDSPVVEKKSRVARRKVPRKIIEEEEEEDEKDQDSDEAFCYKDLKKMADDLLASGSVEPTSRSEINDVAADEPENFSSTGRPMRRVRKTVTPKKVAVSSKRTRKLPKDPSSLIVTDVKSKRVTDESASTDAESSSVGASRKSLRLPKATSVTSWVKVANKQGKESQEVAEILAATPKKDVLPAISRKSNAKIQLVKVDSDASRTTDNAESPKVNRKRRATMAAKELTPAPASPATAKNRRTISEGVESRELPKEQHKILITGLTGGTGLPEDYNKVVKKLGGTVVSEPSKATVLIADKVRRTYKFLCAIARGLRVVSINWLHESKKAARFLDCDDFILKDPAAEKLYKFQLEKSLRAARTKKFLEGYTIIITPKVNQPVISELKGMIEASGGRVLTRAPGIRAWNSKTVIVSREEDLTAINALLAKCPKTLKVTVQSTEFILSGILQQEVNLVQHQLDIS